MKKPILILHCFCISFSLYLLLLPSPSGAQPSTPGFSCAADANQTTYPCETYAFYQASSPNYLDLASIGDLFGLSRLMIAEPSNISSPAAPLLSGEPLLVPLTCSCNNVGNTTNNDSFSYANISYTIVAGDTFWGVSTSKFANLTTYESVELVNPTLIATNLSIGQEVIFPIFCKCPNRTQIQNRINHLISYVFQPSDNVSTVAARFGVDPQSIIDINGNDTQVSETIFVPVSRLPNFTQPIVVASAPTATEERKGLIIGLSIGLGIAGILLILLMGAWIQRGRGAKKKRLGDAEDRKQYWTGKKEEQEVNLMAGVSECLDKYRVFKMEELREATEGFSSRCLIQGSVYSGSIDGEVYAIKKMKWNATEELKILQKVNHGNLVKLEGFCIDQNDATSYLVYEFVEHGSLYSWLHETNTKTDRLNWKTRLRIAVDIANGLQYVHEHTRPRVVHKDIKSSNILLDSTMRGKIANFGLAKSGCNAITMHIVGTQGYIAPEYLSDGIVSTRMDVFSFGVVLLELVSGREALDEEGRVLWASAVRVFDGVSDEAGKAERVREWMDESLLGDTISIESVVSVMNLAVTCLNKDPSKRPSMVDIVYSLCKSDELFFDISEDNLSPQPLLAR